jgi:hypothetical protein
MFKVEIQTLRVRTLAKTSLCDALLPFVFGCQSASCDARPAHRAGTRGPGLNFVVELIGIEPTTSSLQSWRSTN